MKTVNCLLLFLLFATNIMAKAPNPPCENFHVTGLDLNIATKLIEQIKQSIIRKDLKKLSSFSDYPLRLNTPKKKYRIKDSKHFLKVLPQVINDKWKQKVISADKKNSLCNAQGIGLNNGSLWITAPKFHTERNVLKIIAINVY